MNYLFILGVIVPVIFYATDRAILSGGNYSIQNQRVLSILFLVVMALLMAITDFEDPETDKYRYAYHFLNDYKSFSYEDIRDPLWALYNVGIRQLTGSPSIFFLITSFLYFGCYYFFAQKVFSTEYVALFLIIVAGMFGFWGYGTNTIRNGLALGFCLIAFTNNKIWQAAWFIVAIFIHKSVALIVIAYYATKYIKNTKWYVVLWLLCFAAAANGISLLEYADLFSLPDERFDMYTNWQRDNYQSGFRIDFIIYSLLPGLIALQHIKKLDGVDDIYKHYFNMYVLLNAIWLLIIRIPFTNRFAYMSWFLIPILAYYPYTMANGKNNLSARSINLVIFLFMFINIFLTLK